MVRLKGGSVLGNVKGNLVNQKVGVGDTVFLSVLCLE